MLTRTRMTVKCEWHSQVQSRSKVSTCRSIKSSSSAAPCLPRKTPLWQSKRKKVPKKRVKTITMTIYFLQRVLRRPSKGMKRRKKAMLLKRRRTKSQPMPWKRINSMKKIKWLKNQMLQRTEQLLQEEKMKETRMKKPR